jgi:ArsR family transcriptional regulator
MESSAIQVDLVLAWFESLADPTRLRLVRLLERNELGVAELCDILQRPQSTVSRHLKVLADSGWVSSRKHGTTHLYRTLLDELAPAARQLWLVAREQTQSWPTVEQDQLRLQRRLQERTASERFFAGAAEEWDKLRGQLYGRHFSQAACLALLPETQVIADLGCGTGEIAAELAPFALKVIGIDSSAAMLKSARKRLESLDNVELHRADFSELPIVDQSCDAVMIVLALTYVADPPAALAEAARILKPSGKLVIVDLLRHAREDFRRQMQQQWPGFDLAAMRDWISGVGLRISVCRPLPPEADAKGPALFLATAVHPQPNQIN